MQSAVPKQYLPLAGRTVIEYSLGRLAACPGLRAIHVGLSEDDTRFEDVVGRWRESVAIKTYRGGVERAHTVLNGLDSILTVADPDDWVLVHDAVRPCVTVADITKLIAAVAQPHRRRERDGAVLAAPLVDSLKRVGKEGTIRKTVPREQLWRALTPQIFPVLRLRAALQAVCEVGQIVTDESQAIELTGGHPRIVPGRPDNLKLTRPGDLAIADAILRAQAAEDASGGTAP